MSANSSNYPLQSFAVNIAEMPPYLMRNRAPLPTDIAVAGTRWQDNSTNPPTVYGTTGGGNWDVGSIEPATTSVYGTVILTDNNEPVATKFYADNLAIAGAPAWSETVSGIGKLSTTLQATTGTDDDTAMTPLKVAQVLAGGGSSPTFNNVVISGTLDVTGLTTLSGSATIVSGATALNLAADASTGAINIGSGAGARTITIGNLTGATALVVRSGTGGIALSSTGAGDITANSSDTLLLDSAGVLELNSSAGVISIGNDAVAQNINVGTGAAARVITLGNSTGATQVVLNAGTAGVNIGTNAIAHAVSIGNQTGASSVVIDSGTGAINIGTAIAKVITIGNVTGATQVVVNSGTGGVQVVSTGAGTITANSGSTLLLDSVGVMELNSSAGVISIGNDAVAQNINVGTGAAARAITIGNSTSTTSISLNTGTGSSLNLGTNAVAHTVTIGNITTTSAVAINSGTGGVSIVSTSTGDITLNSGDTVLIDGTGVVEINSSSGVIGIGNDAVAQNINIGTGAAARVITIGNVTSTTGIVLNSGTGNIALNTTGTGDVLVNSADTVLIDSAGVLELNSSAGAISIGNDNVAAAINIGTGSAARTISIGTGVGGNTVHIADGAGVNTITIGNGASANTVTLGSTNTTSTTVINGGSGDVKVTGSNLRIATTGKGLQIKAGAATDFAGNSVLTAGTVTISNTNIAAGDMIFLQRIGAAASTTLGELSYTISAGVGFTVTSLVLGTPGSTQTGDVSTFAYFIVRPL